MMFSQAKQYHHGFVYGLTG